MTQETDIIAAYGRSRGWEILGRTLLVEGTTDADLFRFAARLEQRYSGMDLTRDLAIVAAGERDAGGARGVGRELLRLHGYTQAFFGATGRPRYRFVGLFDRDRAGSEVIKDVRSFDRSIREFQHMFRLHPVMPTDGNLDPGALERAFREANAAYSGLVWEVEDLVATDFVEAFLGEHGDAMRRETRTGDKVHRDFTPDGKALLHRFIRKNAIRADLMNVIDTLRAMRYYLRLAVD